MKVLSGLKVINRYRMLKIKTYFPLIVAFLIVLSSCNQKDQKNEHSGHNPHAGHKEMKAAHKAIKGDTLHLNDRLEWLANIEIDTVHSTAISDLDHLLGTAAVDQDKITVITTRVKGRIEKLHVRNPGAYIRKGEILYQIYSEVLLADINELIFAVEQDEERILNETLSKTLLDASRNKLKLWGLSRKQIEEIERTKEAYPYINFYSHSSGVITDLMLREGEYVEIGSQVARIADLSTLWIETQVYSNEINVISKNPEVHVSFEAYPSEVYKAFLVFNNPTLEENKKIYLVRFRIDNKNQKIKPGMMAYVRFDRRNKKSVVIPKSSLVVGKMKFAWVKTGDNMYERRMIETGIENVKEVQVLSGIEEGEQVVVSGGYLLNSELILRQGGLKGHDMEGM